MTSERTPFHKGAAAGLRAAAAAADMGVAANRDLERDEMTGAMKQYFRAAQAEAEMLARAIRAIDPASVKHGETDADHG